MQPNDLVPQHADRVERSCRFAGAVLLVGAVAVPWLSDVVLSRTPQFWTGWFYGYGVAARILAPAGAMLIATSLAVRALIRPFSRPSARDQLITGLALVALGLLQLTFGARLLILFTDFLGATANAGVLLVEFLASVVSVLALPVGMALLAANPLVRIAQTMQPHTRSAEPPDIESLD